MLSILGEDVRMWDLGCILYWWLSWQREGSNLCPPGWEHWIGLGLLPPPLVSWGRVMLVMVYLRTKQSPLKRPKPLKTAPCKHGPCQLIPTLCKRWELPKLNSPFISPRLLHVALPLFLVCL